MKKQSMFENYPDVVEVDDLRKMLGGISKKLAYRLLSDQESGVYVSAEPIRSPKSA